MHKLALSRFGYGGNSKTVSAPIIFKRLGTQFYHKAAMLCISSLYSVYTDVSVNIRRNSPGPMVACSVLAKLAKLASQAGTYPFPEYGWLQI